MTDSIHRQIQRLAHLQELGQILPATGRDKALAVYRSLDLIEVILFFQIQIGQDGVVYLPAVGVLLPNGEVCLH